MPGHGGSPAPSRGRPITGRDLKALERRVSILRMLLFKPLSTSDIAARLNAPERTIRYDLLALREAGLIHADGALCSPQRVYTLTEKGAVIARRVVAGLSTGLSGRGWVEFLGGDVFLLFASSPRRRWGSGGGSGCKGGSGGSGGSRGSSGSGGSRGGGSKGSRGGVVVSGVSVSGVVVGWVVWQPMGVSHGEVGVRFRWRDLRRLLRSMFAWSGGRPRRLMFYVKEGVVHVDVVSRLGRCWDDGALAALCVREYLAAWLSLTMLLKGFVRCERLVEAVSAAPVLVLR
ncbi:MAG: winged helix-turn-helix domain-containing protein [Thermofilaceae archaeon]